MSDAEMGNTSSSTWSTTYKEIKTKHDNAYIAIDQALSLEDQNRPQEALDRYKEGIKLIDEALRIQVTCPENPDFTWERACVMIQKMKKTRAEILSRINVISEDTSSSSPEQPPSYEEVVGDNQNPVTYNDLANALNALTVRDSLNLEPEVIYMYDGVKLYFIMPNGEVSSTMNPQTMKITLVENEGENVPRGFLQIGDWIYPLIPGVSPCFRTDYGAFILPNVYAETPGSSIGIILPPDTDAAVYDFLENILYGIVGKSEVTKPPELSDKISSGIVNGAWYLSQGLVKGAEKVGDFLNYTTPHLMNHMKTAEQPSQIPRRVSKSMQVAENATGTAAKVTGYVADQVGVATMKLGRFLAPHIQRQGTRLLTTCFHLSEPEASNKVMGVLTVAAGAVEGFSTVYRGLENSASILGQSLKENTVKVVQHKYGHSAGEFTDDTLNTVGNVIYIGKNAKIIHPKNLAKRTAKEAGRAMYYGYRNTNHGASTSSQNYAPLPNEITSVVPKENK